jgi:hypothetical protein
MPTQEFRIVLDGDSSGFVRALKQAGVQVNTLDKNVSQATPKLAALSSTFLRDRCGMGRRGAGRRGLYGEGCQ